MNYAQFKDPVSHICLAGTVVASRSLTQEVAGSNPFTVMTNIFVTEFSEFICLAGTVVASRSLTQEVAANSAKRFRETLNVTGQEHFHTL